MMQSFFVKLFTSYTILISFVLIADYFFSMNMIRGFYIQDLRSHLANVAHAITPEVLDRYSAGDIQGVARLVKELNKDIEARITIIEPDGKVIADSKSNPANMENHSDRQEVYNALHGNQGESIRFSSTVGEKMLYLAVPIKKDDRIRLVIRLSLYMENIGFLVKNLGWKFAVMLLLLFIPALFITWYLSHGISKPVKEIADATRKFASGDFNIKLFLENKGEISEVAESFNDMVSRQKDLFDKLSQSRAEIEAILSSMHEGLLVINRDGKIILSNRCFEKLTKKTDIFSKAYWEIFRVPKFEDYIKQAFDSGESFYQVIEIETKTFRIGFNSMNHGTKDEKIVMVFMDITDFKKLEKIKKDFIVNLTHELKTPLTAVKGFVETLEEEEEIKNTQYIEIIKRHTDRMAQIVSDMLTLSELEDKRREIRFEPVNLLTTVSSILKIFQEKINSKQLNLDVSIEPGIPSFPGEQFKIEQMIVNLIDNAVKYTDKGGISIEISTLHDQRKIRFQVRNTGSVIPEKSLSRIFERFYVVDKSRSRKLGGTGLGLSIVKHIVMLHNGEISVESTENRGTIFSILLPY